MLRRAGRWGQPVGYAAAGRAAGARRAGGRTGLLRLWARAGPVSAAAAGLAAEGTGCGEDGTSAAGHSGGPDELRLTEGSGHEVRRGLPRHCKSAIGHLGEAQLLTTGAATRCEEDCCFIARPPLDISEGPATNDGSGHEVRRGLPRCGEDWFSIHRYHSSLSLSLTLSFAVG